jgi:predicted DNA-binding transcriptional regulator AlpA
VRRPLDQADVLRPGELRAKLGLGRSRFFELQQQGRFRRLESPEVSAALGALRYSRKKVEAWIEQAAPAFRLTKSA